MFLGIWWDFLLPLGLVDSWGHLWAFQLACNWPLFGWSLALFSVESHPFSCLHRPSFWCTDRQDISFFFLSLVTHEILCQIRLVIQCSVSSSGHFQTFQRLVWEFSSPCDGHMQTNLFQVEISPFTQGGNSWLMSCTLRVSVLWVILNQCKVSYLPWAILTSAETQILK